MVIDTSVIAKWFTREDDSWMALELRDRIVNGEIEALTPDLIYYELGNLLSRQNNLSDDEVMDALTSMEDIGIQIMTPYYDLLEMTAVISCKYNVTFYDASFVALAQNSKTEFLTADTKLVSKTRKLGFVSNLTDYAAGN